MKTMLLSALLCTAGFGVKAQVADAANFTHCDAIVRFTALDPGTCAVLAVDPTTYLIPAGTPPPFFIAPAWLPAPPGVPFLVEAEVADAACGFPGVLVSGGPCNPPTAPLPFCPFCAPSVVDDPSPVFPPGGGGLHWPVVVHP